MFEENAKSLSLVFTPEEIHLRFKLDQALLADASFLNFKQTITDEHTKAFIQATIAAFEKNNVLKTTALLSYSFLFSEEVISTITDQLHEVFLKQMEQARAEIKSTTPYNRQVIARYFKAPAFFDLLDFIAPKFPAVYNQQFDVFKYLLPLVGENEQIKLIKFQEKVELNEENAAALTGMLHQSLKPRNARREAAYKKEITIGGIAIVLFFIIRIVIRIAAHNN